MKIVKALKRNNNAVTHAAIDMLNALMVVSIDSSLDLLKILLEVSAVYILVYHTQSMRVKSGL